MLPTLRMTLFIQNYDCWRNTSFQRRVFLLIVYVDPHLDCLVLSIGSLSGTLFQFCKSITVLTANNQEYMYWNVPPFCIQIGKQKIDLLSVSPPTLILFIAQTFVLSCTLRSMCLLCWPFITPNMIILSYWSRSLPCCWNIYPLYTVCLLLNGLVGFLDFPLFTFNLWWRELPKSFWEDTIRPMFVSTWQRIRVCRWLKSMFLWFGEWYVEPNH